MIRHKFRVHKPEHAKPGCLIEPVVLVFAFSGLWACFQKLGKFGLTRRGGD